MTIKHPKYWYRVTKYDPKKRRPDGTYSDQTEWTEFNEVKNPTYNFKDYLLTENAYIYTIHYFIEKNKEKQFQLFSKEVKNKSTGNSVLFENLIEVEYNVKKILRRKMWSKIRCKNMCVHFGWDYYMFIGSNTESDTPELEFGGVKIYIEKIDISPYAKRKELL
jgi:hypothetical protein